MKVIKHVCDECGTEIRGEVAAVKYVGYTMGISGVIRLEEPREAELCAKCNMMLLDFLNVEIRDDIRMKLEAGEVPPVITFES